MTEAELCKWMLRRLGAPLVKVEVTQAMLQDAIDYARHWFAAKKGVKKQMIMPMMSGQVEYNLPDIVDTVLDVAFPVAPMDISMVFSPFILLDDKVPYDVFAAPQSAGLYSSFTQTLQYIETAKRILGAEPDWRQEGRKLYIFPIPKNDAGLWIDFKSNNFTVEQLNERDHDLVKRYALAKLKLDLAEVRGKHGENPGAAGNISLNAANLQQTAMAELEKLDQEIILSGFPMGFLKG